MLLGSERKLVMLSATGLSPSRVQHSLLLRLAARHLYSSPTTPFSRFRLLPFRSPLLRESLLLSFPLATKMFQFTSSHSVTGGVYKARERIHRRMADRRLLAIPASCRRVAAYNPN
ncbi:hypothetical protein VNO77_45702 [Canavalia gladiata]|uniref:Uncharacterized protein n=1 Tax=Canavalia gladiata TaxID=3824 RepID=A0AAN9JL98_CANGL